MTEGNANQFLFYISIVLLSTCFLTFKYNVFLQGVSQQQFSFLSIFRVEQQSMMRRHCTWKPQKARAT